MGLYLNKAGEAGPEHPSIRVSVSHASPESGPALQGQTVKDVYAVTR